MQNGSLGTTCPASTRRRNILPVAFLLLLALLLTGCSEKAPAQAAASVAATAATAPAITPSATPTPVPTPVPTPTPEPTPPPTEDVTFIPPNPDIRPVAVMIDNQGDRPLPQAGIRQAQIVYEILTEYRITRYLAFFWEGMPEMVGPVRSSRHYFLDWAMEYDAVYVHYGYSPQAMKDIPRLKIQNINGLVHGEAFWDTDPDAGNWQDSFTSATRVAAQIETRGLRTEPAKRFPFTYHDRFTVPAGGTPATQIALTYGKGFTAGYAYDDKTGLYARTRNGAAQMERNTALQVTPRNLVIQVVSSAPIPGDKESRIDMKTVGKGIGWLATAGKTWEITWEKTARDAQTIYRLADGSEMILNPGQTWIQVIPSAKTVEMTSEP